MHPTSFSRLPSNWREYPPAESLRDELKQFLRDEFSRSSRWGIKQPVTSLVLPLYNDVFAEMGISPHFVLCVRNPLEAMKSESKLDFGDSYRVMAPLGKMAVGSWLRYTLGSFADTVNHSLSVVVYDQLLSNPENILQAIVQQHPGWTPSPADWDNAVNSIQGGMRHQQSSIVELDEFPSIVRKTYETAVRIADGSEEARSDALDLHREFETWNALLTEPVASAGKFGLAWFSEGKRCISEINYIPTNGWQTVRLVIDAPSKTAVSGLIYGLPCRAWIRRSVWRRASGVTPAQIRCGLGSTLAYEKGVYRLEAVFEPDQIQFVTPGGTGPFELELDFLLEVGTAISAGASARLAKQLEGCVQSVEQLAQRLRTG